MKIKILYVALLLVVTSCAEQQVVSQLTKHSWAVEEVEYQDTLYGLFFFTSNTMSFQSDGSCKLPYFNYSIDSESSWEFGEIKDSENFSISLYNSDNEFLDGKYEARIINDSTNYRVLVMENEGLKLVCKSER